MFSIRQSQNSVSILTVSEGTWKTTPLSTSARGSASQAECLRQIRESNAYTLLGLTWDEFCRDRVGLTRPRVDSIIHCLEEFGATYFRLSEIVRISPETYRQVAPAIENEALEIDGESVPITPENAVRIRQAVHHLRADLQISRSREGLLADPDVAVIQTRLESCFREMSRLAGSPSRLQQASLRGLVNFSLDHLRRIKDQLPV